MSGRSAHIGDASYEILLAAEDRRNRRIALIVAVVVSSALSLYFDLWGVFWLIAPVMLIGFAASVWNTRRMAHIGYPVRGKAFLRGAWEFPAALLCLAVLFWVQSELGLWFAQHEIAG